ncbi:hypothetical protein C7999DRAFT_13063 [Corynascus novoguineensis]|uniref:Uncharacterized protein n=1 Tax=Corynascus novoguineensis TaxID=1126955 RepID=A0AAN7CVE3_9PEZI|nr:hypothetical protein C7999DRAFT_13063 [Corynascus novoguineensis]
MASFDPIEFFGIGHGQDIVVIRHLRSRSPDTFSLSSVSSPSNTAALERSSFQMIPKICISNEPRLSYRTFVDITPEDSLFGTTTDIDDGSLPATPNVSDNSSWASDTNLPLSVRRYIENHERHEALLLLLANDAPLCAEARAVNARNQPAQYPYPSEEADILDTPEHGRWDGGDLESPTPNPLRRYLRELQPHEQLALGHERQGQQTNPTLLEFFKQNSRNVSSSISLAADSAATGTKQHFEEDAPPSDEPDRATGAGEDGNDQVIVPDFKSLW